ncbi:MAG: RpoL/Rpb11 RNA polymerase subunit family protein [Promethearchaeota archaeon]
MAKKKAVKPEDTEDNDIDGLMEELLEEEEIEEVFPEVEKKKEREPEPESFEEPIEEEEEFEIEEEARFPDYKYLNVTINRGLGKNDYEVSVEGQSHGFCNILVKHLLEIEGVNIAAYKVNNVELPKIFIRLENSKDYQIKDILHKGIESLRSEVIEVQKLFKKIT